VALSAPLVSVQVSAQETTSAVRGVVTDESGSPLPNTTVTIMSNTAGITREATTDASGQFFVRNLPVGSDYSFKVSNTGFSAASARGVNLNLGQVTNLDFTLSGVEEVLVTGEKLLGAQVAVGPNATFNLAELESLPAINRNITDVLRTDPRIFVDESRGDINAVQCGGANPRFNSLTVDGIRLNDGFGLNSNGYPTERMPFSYDAISQVAVEIAPFDVVYGGFSACNINAVTKSGGNEIIGGAFWDYTSDDFRGDSLEGDSVQTQSFDEQRYGFNIGAPLIKDRLFIFAAYEKLEGANLFDRGPVGSGAINEVNITQTELDEIADIARTLYQYDPGPIPTSLDHEDEKLLVKLDWNISDSQRLALTYNYNDGENFTESDGDLSEFEFENHLYERGAELNSYIATLYSDWTPEFNTEIRIGYAELDNRQLSVGGTDFGEIRVETDDVDVYLGGDDSRQSNKLKYDILTLVFKGHYQVGNHYLSFGYEQEALDIFNLFVQHTETEIRFDGIENFRNGFASAIYYNNAPSQNPSDAAADWGYEVNTVYLQDEFAVGEKLTVVAGLRYDWYTSDDEPVTNPDFLADYGFSNGQTVDGEGLLQPRIGFTYDYSDALTLRGGVGLYSGGNPNVWLSNNYSNNNVLQFGQRGRSFGYTDGSRSLFDSDVVYALVEDGAPAGPGWGVPQELVDAVASGVGDNFEINYLDPNFDLPSEWKLAFGGTYVTANDYVLTADLLWSRLQDSAIVKRGDLEQIGTNPDGYPQYDSVREPSFVLTNANSDADTLLLSFSVAKSYDNGIDWRLGYAYTDAEDVNPMTSAVAFSNYVQRTFFDPQEDVASTSNWQIQHRFTGVFNYRARLWGDNETTVSLFGHAHSGFPFSYTVDGGTGTAAIYGFTPFLDFIENVLEAPGTRNQQEGDWWTKVDLRVEQEFGGFTDTDRVAAFFVIDNFTNFLNDDWGILKKPDFPFGVVRGEQEQARIGDASLWEMRFGIRYDF
jgi:hypothetical protein